MKAFLERYLNYIIFFILLILLITIKIINPPFIKSISNLSFDLYQKIFTLEKRDTIINIVEKTAEELEELIGNFEDPLISQVATQLKERLNKEDGQASDQDSILRIALCELYHFAVKR